MTAQRNRSHAQTPPASEPTSAPSEAPREQGSLVVVQERVLAEISHELGNFFHKLYYWSEYISEGEEVRKTDATAGHMLQRTITNLEDFLKVALEYFYPIKLNFTKITAKELLDSFVSNLAPSLNGNGMRFDRDAEVESATILVDLSRISQAFRIALDKIDGDLKAGASLTISVGAAARREYAGLEILLAVEAVAPASSLARTAEAGVEWAVAQKLIEMHGGDIAECHETGARKEIRIFLPSYA